LADCIAENILDGNFYFC